MLDDKLQKTSRILGLVLASPLLYPIPCIAQVSSDNTTNTRVDHDPNSQTIEVRDGIRVGSLDSNSRNVFHSFDSFAISPGEVVIFSDVLDVDNIFGRVTGNQSSLINGTISVTSGSNANLFLINPRGIIFGPEAVLDINGSFVASTASNIQFQGGLFGTSGQQTEPSLLIGVPIGLQFGNLAEDITVDGSSMPPNSPVSGINVASGRTIAFIGGDIHVSRYRIFAPAGRIELVSVAPESTVGISQVSDDDYDFNPENVLEFREIYLRNLSRLVASEDFQPNGEIELTGQDIFIENSSISADTRVFFADSDLMEPGDIRVSAAGLLEIDDNSSITALNQNFLFEPFPEFENIGGDISISARQINVSGSSSINTSTEFQGRAGNIQLRATDSINLLDRVQVAASNLNNENPVPENIIRNSSGNIEIIANSLTIESGSQVNTSTIFEGGNASDIEVVAHESLQVRGAIQSDTGLVRSGLFAVNQGDFDAGDITITSADILLEERGSINAEARGQGVGGTLTIHAEQLTVRSGGQVTASTQVGSAGNVNISADTGQVAVDGVDSLIAARATGTGGSAGGVNVNARSVEVTDGGKISAATTSGSGGNVTFQNVNELEVTNAQISASTATGVAGSLTVNENAAPAELIVVSGFLLDEQGNILLDTDNQPIPASLTVQATGTGGRAGDSQLNAVQLTVADGAAINVSSEDGRAGNLEISAETILLENGTLSAVTRVTLPEESGANILLSDVVLLRMSDGSLISASALAEADGGNVDIDASQGFVVAVLNENNDIVANAIEGDGGRIDITALGLYNFEERRATLGNGTNDIDASSEFGQSGTILINDPINDPSRARTELPASVLDVRNLIDRSCEADVDPERNTFVVTGRGGLPPSPGEIVRSDNAALADLGTEGETMATSAPTGTTDLPDVTTQPIPEIVMAETWYRDADGVAILATQAPETTRNINLPVGPHCD